MNLSAKVNVIHVQLLHCTQYQPLQLYLSCLRAADSSHKPTAQLRVTKNIQRDKYLQSKEHFITELKHIAPSCAFLFLYNCSFSQHTTPLCDKTHSNVSLEHVWPGAIYNLCLDSSLNLKIPKGPPSSPMKSFWIPSSHQTAKRSDCICVESW